MSLLANDAALRGSSTITRRFLEGECSVYVAPDAVMPFASAIAAVVGMVLMFWRRLVGAVKLIVQRVIRR